MVKLSRNTKEAIFEAMEDFLKPMIAPPDRDLQRDYQISATDQDVAIDVSALRKDEWAECLRYCSENNASLILCSSQRIDTNITTLVQQEELVGVLIGSGPVQKTANLGYNMHITVSVRYSIMSLEPGFAIIKTFFSKVSNTSAISTSFSLSNNFGISRPQNL